MGRNNRILYTCMMRNHIIFCSNPHHEGRSWRSFAQVGTRESHLPDQLTHEQPIGAAPGVVFVVEYVLSPFRRPLIGGDALKIWNHMILSVSVPADFTPSACAASVVCAHFCSFNQLINKANITVQSSWKSVSSVLWATYKIQIWGNIQFEWVNPGTGSAQLPFVVTVLLQYITSSRRNGDFIIDQVPNITHQGLINARMNLIHE